MRRDPVGLLALGQGASPSLRARLEFDTTVTVHNGRFVLHEDGAARRRAARSFSASYLDRAASP